MPRWLKRFCFALLALLAVATGAVFAFGETIAAALTRQVIARVERLAAARGMELRDVRFDGVRFTGVTTLQCDGLRGTVLLRIPDAGAGSRAAFACSAAHVVVNAGWPWSGKAGVEVIDGNVIRSEEDGEILARQQLTGIQASVVIPFSWWDLRESIAGLEQEGRMMIVEGRTALPLKLQAMAGFKVGQHQHEFAVRTAPTVGDGAHLVLDRADVERISQEYTHPLTATEIDLVMRYPHRAPVLLRLTEQATRAALAQRQRDRKFPYDAYRHVYWSWLLTRAFDPAFAEDVTNAHEVGATYEVDAASRRMDLHNNALGRAYAVAGVPEGDLVRRVLTDPNVQRVPTADPAPRPGSR